MIVKYAWLTIAAVASVATAPASATTSPSGGYEFFQSYTVASPFDLNHGITYNTYANGDGFTNSFNLAAPGGIITDGFPKSSSNPPLLTYLMATSDLGDLAAAAAGPDEHLVIGFNDIFASQLLAGGQDFSDIFTGYDENTLIQALTLLDTSDLPDSDPGRAGQIAAKQQAVSLVFSFSENLVSLGGLTGADGGSLTLVSFSTPALAGNATSNLEARPISGAVPEPVSWSLMLGGFGAIGVTMRQRRRASGLAA